VAVERRALAAQAKESQAAREVASQLATEEREHSLKLAREDRILGSVSEAVCRHSGGDEFRCRQVGPNAAPGR